MLGILDFFQLFIVEIDACGRGMSAVIMQSGRPISFLSKAFNSKNLGMSVYEK